MQSQTHLTARPLQMGDHVQRIDTGRRAQVVLVQAHFNLAEVQYHNGGAGDWVSLDLLQRITDREHT